ncbi:MAG: hypothetical protein JWP92_2793 [Caulobacter sp.]|nr:hypothetical protein [Caulobacter sp.]
MRTDELIDALAAELRPVRGGAIQRRFAAVAAAGALAALVILLVWLGVRPDLDAAAGGRMFWMKASYTFALALAGFWASERLARPAGSGRKALIFGLAVLALFGGVAVVKALGVSPLERLLMLKGQSWSRCTLNILLLSLPMLGLSLWMLRRLAPTRPTAAGFAAGVFSGGVAATIYGLHCAETAMAFVGVWYTLGVLGCGVIGAAIGRWALRW